jgi:hypothetical protein
LEKGESSLKKKKMSVAPLRPARFLFLLLPPPLCIGSYQSTEGEVAKNHLRQAKEGTKKEGEKEQKAKMKVSTFLYTEAITALSQR